MNLVVRRPTPRPPAEARLTDRQIDDAIEVKQVSKTNPTETRRNLGVSIPRDQVMCWLEC